VLEIGCGWGALAEMATTEFGASITGVTLSTEQLAAIDALDYPAFDVVVATEASKAIWRTDSFLSV